MGNLRQKITNYEQKIFGETLSTDINKKGLAGLITGGAIFLGGAGCVTTDRPYIHSGIHKDAKNFSYDIANKFKLGELDENDSRYQTKGLSIFGENFYVLGTDLGDAMFRQNKSIVENKYILNNKDEIKGTTSLLSGEGGMYFLDYARMNETTEKKGEGRGKKADVIKIAPKSRSADVKTPGIIKKQGDLGIFNTTEKNLQWEIDHAIIPRKGPHYVIRVERESRDFDESDFYNFYLIPVNNSKIRIDQQGKVEIENIDHVYRPTFKPWKQINKDLNTLTPEQKAKNRTIFTEHGMRTLEKKQIE